MKLAHIAGIKKRIPKS